MKNRLLIAAVAALALGATAAAQQSTLASLFGTYTIGADFGTPKDAPAWGGTTTWVAADGKGSVIVMVRAAPYFRVFTTDGKPVKSWGDAGLFNEAHSVHFAPDGTIWASDPNDHVVHKFSADGQKLMTLGKKGVMGDNASKDAFNRPNAITVGPTGDIFVSDGYGNQRVVQFTADGTFVRIIGGKKGNGAGEMDTVHGVAIDPQGRILVNDSGNQRVSVFDRNGTFLKQLAAPSRGGIAVRADGTVYVSDVNSGMVTVFRNDQIVDVIKVEGRPHGLAVDPATGDVYTSSTVMTKPNVTKATLRRTAATSTR